MPPRQRMRKARIFSAQSEMRSSTQYLWCPSIGLAANCLEAIAGTCFRQVNLEILCSVWKLAHPGLAPCWHGHAPTLDSSTRWLWRSRDTSVRASTQKKSARQHAQTLRDWSARTTSIREWPCAASSFMLGEVTAPQCFCQVKVFHELTASSVDLLDSVFV